jgi:hypothetical protein
MPRRERRWLLKKSFKRKLDDVMGRETEAGGALGGGRGRT